MRSPLERVAEAVIAEAVVEAWGVALRELEYLPEGGGAYHWVAHADDGRRWFVTCDDLDTKPWLGSDRDSVFDGLVAAYGAALDLRTAAELSFVVAPVASRARRPAVRIDKRHSVTVFEYVSGQAGRWGRPLVAGAQREVVAMLAELHRSTSAVRPVSYRGLEVPARSSVEEALDDLNRPWDGGPLSEMARHELAIHAEMVVRGLANLDQLAARLATTDVDLVVTHGEPHPGNLIRTRSGLALVDWDTVALARPERDLWMLNGGNTPVETLYRELTGVTLEPQALQAHRLLWALADVAAFTVQLRGEHQQDADAEKAVAGLRRIFSGHEPSPYGIPPA